MNIKQGDLVIDTFYYDDRKLMEPLFIYLYVLSVVTDSEGKQTVTLAPAIYRSLDNPPPHDFTLADVCAQCKVTRSQPYDYYQTDLRDANNKRIGLHFQALSAYNPTSYNIYFKDYSKMSDVGSDGKAAESAENDANSDDLTE